MNRENIDIFTRKLLDNVSILGENGYHDSKKSYKSRRKTQENDRKYYGTPLV